MKKLKAFTLMELIIGMIIGSIVVGFCYTGYSMIFRRYIDYKKIKTQVNEAMLLNETLLRDFEKAFVVEYKNNVLSVKGDSILIDYEFSSDHILRKEKEVCDTFHFEPQEIIPVFLKQDQDGETEVIESFSFHSTVLNEMEEFQFSKQYSTQFLMKLDEKQSNGN